MQNELLIFLKETSEKLRLDLASLACLLCLSYPEGLQERNGADLVWARSFLHELVVEILGLEENVVTSLYAIGGLMVEDIDFGHVPTKPKKKKSDELKILNLNATKTDVDVDIMNSFTCNWMHESIDTRIKAIESLLLNQILTDGIYDARFRVFLRTLCTQFEISWDAFLLRESFVLEQVKIVIAELREKESNNATKIVKRNNKQSKGKKWLKVGLAGVTVGTLIAVTGGLAAPAIASGLVAAGTAIGIGAATTAVVTFVANAGGIVLLTTFFGVKGGTLAAYRTARVVADETDEFYFQYIPKSIRKISESHTLDDDVVIVKGENVEIHEEEESHEIDQSQVTVVQGEQENAEQLTQVEHDASDAIEEGITVTICICGVIFKAKEAIDVWKPDADVPSGHSSEEELQGEIEKSEIELLPLQNKSTDKETGLIEKQSKSTYDQNKAAEDQNKATNDQNESTDTAETKVIPWQQFWASSSDIYALVWERKIILEYSVAFQSLALDQAYTVVLDQALKRTALAALAAAVAIPSLIKSATRVIDNPWYLCEIRAKIAAKELAHILLTRTPGLRPVNLVSYGIGSRVAFEALLIVAKESAKAKKGKGLHGYGVVQDVIFLGGAITPNSNDWKLVREMAAGTIINGYSPTDVMLGIIYRTRSLQKVAGLSAVKVPGIRNINLANETYGIFQQSDYLTKLNSVVNAVSREIVV